MRLRVIQADYGDCLILEYGLGDQANHILVDGGPAGVYANHLKPELQVIAAGGGKIDLMVLSHVDEDHEVGLVDLMSDLATGQNQGQPPFITVQRLWYNTFRQTLGANGDLAGPFASFAAESAGLPSAMQHFAFSVSQGEDLWKASEILNVPRNTGFPGGLVSLAGAPRPVELEGLRLWILGPSQPNLEQYEKDWAAWYAKHKDRPFGASASRAAREIDRSVTNLSSIMFLAESAGRRILMTGDGRGDDLVEGLKQAGLMKAGGLHVDVLKVPHHGSLRNNSQQFFKLVTASQYVISAGKHKNDGNPDLDTLKWIVEAARQRQEEIQLLVTNPNASTGQLEKQYPPASSGYSISYLQPGVNSVVI